ncbi:unnamed protein product, partial [Arabidopsis halleri]
VEKGGDSRVSSDGGQDAMMDDVGEKGRPPDLPELWVEKVKESSGGGRLFPEAVVQEKAVIVAPTTLAGSAGTSGTTPLDDEFIPVKQTRGRAESLKKPVSGGGEVGRNHRDSGKAVRDTAEIATSNKFGKLAENMETLEIREVSQEENKENEYAGNQSQQNTREVQAKLVFGATWAKGQDGPKEGVKDKRTGSLKGLEKTIRPKQSKSVKPMRGLVYGPTTRDSEMSVTGKRLRLEKESVGRPGGCFVKNPVGVGDEGFLALGNNGTIMGSDGKSTEVAISTDLAMVKNPSGKATGVTGQ